MTTLKAVVTITEAAGARTCVVTVDEWVLLAVHFVTKPDGSAAVTVHSPDGSPLVRPPRPD